MWHWCDVFWDARSCASTQSLIPNIAVLNKGKYHFYWCDWKSWHTNIFLKVYLLKVYSTNFSFITTWWRIFLPNFASLVNCSAVLWALFMSYISTEQDFGFTYAWISPFFPVTLQCRISKSVPYSTKQYFNWFSQQNDDIWLRKLAIVVAAQLRNTRQICFVTVSLLLLHCLCQL